MSNRRRTIAAVIVALGAIVYGVSPIDVLPELLMGPLGFGDDIAVVLGAGFAVWKLLTGRDPRNGGGAVPPAA
jgi:uncharacterized membrane protein YkvA (DUF1232 family)